MTKTKKQKPYIITCAACGNQYGSLGIHRCAADAVTTFVERGQAAQAAVDTIIAVEQTDGMIKSNNHENMTAEDEVESVLDWAVRTGHKNIAAALHRALEKWPENDSYLDE